MKSIIKECILSRKILIVKLLLFIFPFYYLLYPNLRSRFLFIRKLDTFFYSHLSKKDLIKIKNNALKSTSRLLINDSFFILALHKDVVSLSEVKSQNSFYLTNYNKFIYFLNLGDVYKAFFIYQFIYCKQYNTFHVWLNTKLDSLLDSVTYKKVIIISDKFIGDEIRLGRLYPIIYKVLREYGFNNIVITCDERVKFLLENSFSYINFVSVTHDEIDTLRNSESSDLAIPLFSMIYFVIRKYQLSTKNLLRNFVDELLYYTIQDKMFFPKNNEKVYIGLSWRSFVWSWARTNTFFKIEEFSFLFDLPNVEIVICQYDRLTKDEMQFLKSYKNVIIPNVDQMHDISNTAALYKSLDYMVTAPSYTSDLSASLGVDTIIIAKTYLSSFWTDDSSYLFFLGRTAKLLTVTTSSELKTKVIENLPIY